MKSHESIVVFEEYARNYIQMILLLIVTDVLTNISWGP